MAVENTVSWSALCVAASVAAVEKEETWKD